MRARCRPAPAAAAPARPAKRSKAGKSKAPKPVPVLPAPGPAGQLPRTSLGGLSDVWAEGGCAEGGAEGGPSLRRRPARAGPSSLHAPEPTGKASVPRVRVPSEGASFNPPAEAHAPLLAAAVGHELERERREERPAWRLEREAIEAAARRALVDQASTTSLPLREGSGEGDEGSDGEEEEEAGVPIVRRAVSDRKKTAAQLNRSRRAREREQEAAAAREQRKREVQLGRLGPILSQLSKDERGRKRRREAAEEARERAAQAARCRPAPPRTPSPPPSHSPPSLTHTALSPTALSHRRPRCAHLGYHTSGPVCGERTLTTAQKLSERTNRARIISICLLHNIVGV